ncbi:DUF1553 domain-containing protein [Rubinisphaera margarita]|uniref:DUF1553 domain-containing protein n=1 Tax=Rubinisphaera margarita TaxID=2909586 RepID=UPI001EE89E7E|nr:DUF1553 domain-containing protein [Rubinisphaera margarita]MCG6154293.1 DUF1553 domain-containing protein [Rubinisphaera margarita]
MLSGPVDFEKHVQPILRQHCFRCHGESHDKGGLRLSRREAALGSADSGESIITPGKPDESLLIHRIADPDYGDVMPLDGEPLSTEQIAVLRQWITEGSNWPDSAAVSRHWAYEPIARPELPEVQEQPWIRTPVDHFILSRLDEEKLKPAPDQDRAGWLRRVSLALIGLPPTPEDVAEFVSDDSVDAERKVVDRLLASPRFGEKWAVGWLDLARYADSNGFQADQLRDSWAYRDWVIEAFNQNKPFDEFVIEQLAGDLLPDATADQRIATGFHRTVTCNVEAGVHPEENRINQVFDRVNTTGTVFMGTSMECAQCHDHKYDPFTQTDYYQLFAYFNNTPLEVKQTAGVTFDFYGPSMELPMEPEEADRRSELKAELAKLQEQRDQRLQEAETEYEQWLADLRDDAGEADWQPLTVVEFNTTGGETWEALDDQSILVTGKVPDKTTYTAIVQSELKKLTALRIEALTHPEIPGHGPGRGDPVRSNFILSEFVVTKIGSDRDQKIELTAAAADYSQPRWEVPKAIDGDPSTGWAIGQEFQKPHWARFQLLKPTTFANDDRLRIEMVQNYGRGRTIGRFRLSAFAGDPLLLDVPEELQQLAAKEKRSRAEENKLRDHFNEADPQLTRLDRKMKAVEKQLNALAPPTTLVMVEMEEPRKTCVLNRGDYLSPGQEVSPAVPALFQGSAGEYPENRLGFAQWLVSDENPLLARVTVNRWWAELFGHGLVATTEDFGTQGEPPTHPELLDWLASELRENEWSMKHVLRQIVLSSTFRQSSRFTPELLEGDPKNELYARGPRFRLTAEIVRDNALAISGLLSEEMSGPPVMPYQPDGIWRSIGRNQPKWVTAKDEDRFRRGVYIVWKRDAPYTSLVSFDAPDRTACVPQRPRTNTPLQALTLLNDPAYAEMALGLTLRMLEESVDETDHSRIDRGFQIAVARDARPKEVEVLYGLLQSERQRVQDDPKLVEQRTGLKLPGFPERNVDQKEAAAWFAVANVLLNLDETVTQE